MKTKRRLLAALLGIVLVGCCPQPAVSVDHSPLEQIMIDQATKLYNLEQTYDTLYNEVYPPQSKVTDTPVVPTEMPIPTPSNTPTPWKILYCMGDYNPTFQIEIDLSEQRLYTFTSTFTGPSFEISSGLPDTPTPIGKFNIYSKRPYASMVGLGYYLANVPWTMYFYYSYGIHGAYWHNNFGHPMSHGCVNMRVEDAEWLYCHATIGTVVTIHE